MVTRLQLMPRTPPEVRLASRSRSLLKRMAWPYAVAMMTSSPSCAIFTETSSSPGSEFMAMSPLLRTTAKSESAVFFDLAAGRGQQHEVGRVLELLDRDDAGHALIALHEDDRRQMHALGVAVQIGNFVRARLVHAALVREEQDRVVRVADDELVDRILFLAHDHAGHAAPATALRAVRVGVLPLDVLPLRDADDDLLLGNQIRLGEFAGLLLHDARAAIVAVLVAHVVQLLLDHGPALFHVRQQVLQVGDDLPDLGQLVAYLLGFQAG